MVDRSGSLLDTIHTVLDASPPAAAGAGTLRVHTLFSIPRQVKSLYPLAHIHPTDLEYNKRASSIGALEEQIFITASWLPQQEKNVAEAPLLILAMELYLYTIPESGAAVLYISKLDSSGYGPKAIPPALREGLAKKVLGERGKFGNTLTATLSSAVTRHFTSFRHWDSSPTRVDHLSVHILARSQRAYLFPSSPENKDKKVLSDGGLIKWWRAVMSDVVVSTRNPSSPGRKAEASKFEIDARAYYVIPGYSQMESHPLVPLVRNDSPDKVVREAGWTYGHPYSAAGASCSDSDLPPLPLHWRSSLFVSKGEGREVQEDPEASDYNPKRVRTVPTLMPHFSDDPKTRFLDEMARDAHEHAGWKKKSSSSSTTTTGEGNSGEAKENGVNKRSAADDTQSTSTPAEGNSSEAKENRTHRRQADDDADDPPQDAKRAKTDNETDIATEAGTGSSSNSGAVASGVPLITLRALMRERQMMDDLAIDEFWERMGFRQECCSGNAVGVLVVLFTRLPTSSSPSSAGGLERQPLSLPYKVLGDLVFKSLMKDTCEWNKRTHAEALTEAWWKGVDREVRRKGGLAQVVKKEEEGLVGEGLIWADVRVKGPTKGQMEEAKSEIGEKNGNAAGGGAGGGATNTLSVKRKKKPTA